MSDSRDNQPHLTVEGRSDYRSRMNTKFTLALVTLLTICLIPVSTVLAVPSAGSVAPEFTLPSVDGKPVSLKDYRGKTVVLEWFNSSCPFVRKHYDSKHMQGLQAQSVKDGVVWLVIDSTSKEHRSFSGPEGLKKLRVDWSFASSDILVDENSEVAKMYGAKTTPHMFVIDPNGEVVYAGAIDDDPDTDGNPAESRNYVKEALRAVTSGSTLAVAETEPYGCSVKYPS